MGRAAGSSNQPQEEQQRDGAKLMKSDSDDVAKLRKKCRNTLFVAGHILARDNLKYLARILRAFLAPVYSMHSDNARRVREPSECIQWHTEMASGAWLKPLQATCDLLLDPQTLAQIGLD
eukprot:4052966-Lingulodinium_polyedra.AAC.1